MSTPRQFLVCDNELHAEVVDQLIMESLRDAYGTKGNTWSGVYSDGDNFGVIWASPASGLWGAPFSSENPDGDMALIILDETVNSEGIGSWSQVVPESIVADDQI